MPPTLVRYQSPPKESRESQTIRILIVDDHSIVRCGLRMFLETDEELECVGEASNGFEAIEAARTLRPDIVLMDLMLPEMDGIEATRSIRRELPHTEVIVLTIVTDQNAVINAMRAGAIGYILKDARADELCRAIKAAASGQVQLSPLVARHLVSEVPVPDPNEPLTDRETDVLRLLAQGKANKQIGHDLKITEKTVKSHVSRIFHKLGVQSRTQAALFALQSGFVSAPSEPPSGDGTRLTWSR